MVETPEPAPDLEVGAGIEARGVIRAPPEWQRGVYERLGVAPRPRGIAAASAPTPSRRARGCGRRDPPPFGGRARAGHHARGRRPAARLRPRRGRPHRRRDARPLQALRPRASAGGQRSERRPPGDPRRHRLRSAGRIAARSPARRPRADRALRAAHGRRCLDPARRGDGGGRDRRGACRKAVEPLVRAVAGRGGDPGPQPAQRGRHRLAAELRGRARDPPILRAARAAAGGPRPQPVATGARRGSGADDLGHSRDGAADRVSFRDAVGCRAAGKSPRPAGGGARDVARHARRSGGADRVAPG